MSRGRATTNHDLRRLAALARHYHQAEIARRMCRSGPWVRLWCIRLGLHPPGGLDRRGMRIANNVHPALADLARYRLLDIMAQLKRR